MFAPTLDGAPTGLCIFVFVHRSNLLSPIRIKTNTSQIDELVMSLSFSGKQVV
jgi:hypothetical protein